MHIWTSMLAIGVVCYKNVYTTIKLSLAMSLVWIDIDYNLRQ